MINRYFGLIGRFFFLAFVLLSIQGLNVARTAQQGDQQDRLDDITFVNAPIEKALVALGSHIKLDVAFDDSVKNKKVTIKLEKVSVQKAIEAILKSAESQVKMKDDHTLLVFADTPENKKKYADLKSWP
jgi:type II secretory pathway component GspD/PulD (secretin)